VIRYLTEDHDRIAQRMNDGVVRRIFAAGLKIFNCGGYWL
jgi:hypothetical protein